MPNRRANPVAVRLHDGRVLVAGGETSSDGRCKSNADIFDPSTNTWSKASGMRRDRCAAAGVLLPNGTVLVVGGVGLIKESGGWMTHTWRLAEIYHPKTDHWTKAGHLDAKRVWPLVERLGKHRVLVAGGGSARHPLVSTEIYSPRTHRWRPTDEMSVPRSVTGSVRLSGGRVLVAGGPRNNRGKRTAEVYGRRGVWRAAGALRSCRDPILFRTASGDVQAIPNGTSRRRRTVYRYDRADNDWSRGSQLSAPRANPQVVSLRGAAFVLGGWGPGTNYTTRSAYLWRPATAEWVPWTRIPQPVTSHSAVKLRDGSVLVLGGQTVIDQGTHIPRKLAYRYYP